VLSLGVVVKEKHKPFTTEVTEVTEPRPAVNLQVK
jgi:hypothetical protein